MTLEDEQNLFCVWAKVSIYDWKINVDIRVKGECMGDMNGYVQAI